MVEASTAVPTGGLRLDPDQVDAIREFTHGITVRAEGKVPYRSNEVFRAVGEFASWAWLSAGLALDERELLTRPVIAYYVQTGCGQLTEAARGNRRSLLLRVSEQVAGGLVRRLPPLQPSDPSTPYSGRDLVSIISWARGQSTQERKTNAHLLICLGFGAGLSAQEIIALRVEDIAARDGEIDIRVRAGRPRTVPVLHRFAEAMPAPLSDDPKAFAFRPGRTLEFVNAISNFVQRGYAGGLRPSSQRMRATWIVHHLNAGTPLPLLVAAAGLESLDALARFQRFIDDIDTATAARTLRFASYDGTRL